MKNQCQGCQAGWPIKEHKWPIDGSKSIMLHTVNSGYEGEMVVCTKGNYETNEPQKEKE